MKKTISIILFFLLLVMTFSCKTISTGFRFNENNNISHVPSGVLFLERIGSFQYFENHCYDGRGFDVSVGYNDYKNNIALTHYIYPTIYRDKNYSIEEHIIDCEKEISKYHENAELIKSEKQKLKRINYIKKEYKYKDHLFNKYIEVKSSIILFKEKNWFIKLS